MFRPFESLPFELIGEIFNFLLHNDPMPFAFDYIRLLRLCHRIRDVILNTPSLWCFVRIAPGPELASTLLRASKHLLRSKDAGLHLEILLSGSLHGAEMWLKAKPLLQPHAWRIRTIMGRFSNSFVCRNFLLQLFGPHPSQTDRPKLRKVTAFVASVRMSMQKGDLDLPSDLSETELDNLSHWSQTGCSPFILDHGFRGILKRFEILRPLTVDYSAYLAFLAEQPNLEYIKLQFDSNTSFKEASQHALPSSPIPLKSLRYYHITYLTGYRLCTSAFYAPSLEALDVAQRQNILLGQSESSSLPLPSFPKLDRLRLRTNNGQLARSDISNLSPITHLFLHHYDIQRLTEERREVRLQTIIDTVLPTCYNLSTLSFETFNLPEILRIINSCPNRNSIQTINIHLKDLGVKVKPEIDLPSAYPALRRWEGDMETLRAQFDVNVWSNRQNSDLAYLRREERYSSVESYWRGLLLVDELDADSILAGADIWPEHPGSQDRSWECSS